MSDKELNSIILLYKKILIIGSPGSGKTTIAKGISKNKVCPIFHLDDIYWLEDWKRPSDLEWNKKLKKILKQDNWIIEGNYADSLILRLQYCDCIILVEESTLVCVWRVVLRGIKRLLGESESLPKRIRNSTLKKRIPSISLKFFMLIILYRFRILPKMKGAIKKFNKPLFIFNKKLF